MLVPLSLFLFACPGPIHSSGEPDLAADLEPGQVRAGVVTDESALFGGISAEGQVGDVKIYNDRVRFVLQGFREGDFFVADPGTVVDADVTRPPGQPGRDVVDEWGAMFGIGRLVRGETIAVVEDGSRGRALVRVSGEETPLLYLVGAVEDPGIIPDLGLHVTTDYILEPDATWLEVRSTVTATDDEVTIRPGDVLFGSKDVADRWCPGSGITPTDDAPVPWTGYMSRRNDVAIAILAEGDALLDSGGMDVFGSLLELAPAIAPAVTVPEGGSFTYVRHYGVGRDLAQITDAWMAEHGPSERLSGIVDAPDGPVAGARVNVLVDGDPWTVAVTDDQGGWSALVPEGADVEIVADGRGPGLFTDLPLGAASYSADAAATVRAEALDSLANGALPVPLAQGRGVAVGEPLVLGEPARVTVRSGDGRPFEVRLTRTAADPEVDGRVVLPRPEGRAAWGWSRDGEVTMEVEAGTYDLLADRGPRFGVHQATFTVAAGEEALVDVSLPEAYAYDGWMLADPHVHASPSPDASIPMEDRLVVMAARGVSIHFGTDHDHVADYRPLLGVLGLEPWLHSVVADEVSPILRGHFNVYPLESVEDAGNGGAWLWYAHLVPDTQALFDALYAQHGDILVQANHPVAPGLASAAHWSNGHIGAPDHWSEDFEVIEVLNGGDGGAGLPFYLDLLRRGLVTTPVGSSDAHGYWGSIGVSTTWIDVGTDQPLALTDEMLKTALRARKTQVSRGAFLEMSVDPGTVVTGSTMLTVTAHAPPFSSVDRLVLYENGARGVPVESDSATFQLAPAADSAYVVMAESDHTMNPLTGQTPWAMSAAILVDVAGDGWTAPFPPLEIEE